LRQHLGLTAKENLKLIRKTKGRAQRTHHRYQQSFDGLPIWGHHIIATQDANQRLKKLHGTLVSEIESDVALYRSLKLPSTAQEALAAMKLRYMQSRPAGTGAWRFDQESSQKMIFIDDFDDARICYVVSFFVDLAEGGAPARPTIIMDAATGEIIKEFDALPHAEAGGPGGNLKVGNYTYGQQFPLFEVSQSGSECFMDTPKVTTWNMNHGSSTPFTHSFACPENTYKEINGAFSPLNDAHYFGSLTHDMFVDWLGSPPLPFQLVLGVHYGNQFENAFWGGNVAIFGDGAAYFHPLVGLNVVAHEIAHGFTEQHSDLIYDGQSGGINESFSDMAGEAAEYYHGGTNNFLVGDDIVKGPGALRYMADPPRDGWSIDSVNDYIDGLPVHFSSGVFNKAFYILATKPGWNTRMAFEVFAKANQFYWEPLTGFIQGAYGAIDAAALLGYSVLDVKDAFASVDIYVDVNIEPQAAFEYEVNSLTATFTDTSTCSDCTITSWQWDFGDGFGATTPNPVHVYTTAGTYSVSLTVTDDNGETDSTTRTLSVSGPPPEPIGPTAAFGYTADDLSVAFADQSTPGDAAIVGWQWDFGDGRSATTQNPVHVYAAVGTYTVALTVTDSNGQTVSTTRTLSLSGTPTNYCPAAGKVYQLQWIANVQVGKFSRASEKSSYSDFTADIIEAPKATALPIVLTHGPDISTYPKYWRVWADLNRDGDFNDAGEILFEDAGVNEANGVITIPAGAAEGRTRLRVALSLNGYPNACGTFNAGEVEDYTLAIGASGPEPTGPAAAFGYTADDLSVAFTDQSTAGDADITSWQWDFGDGQSAATQNPVHVYTAAGTYTVSLTVTDDNGETDSTTRTLSVSGAPSEPIGPTAAFGYTADDLSVAFTDQSTAGDADITSWQWDFGDGQSAATQNPVHVYAAAGTHTVALTVTDDNGQTDSTTRTLSLSGTPTNYCPAAGKVYQLQWIANVQVGNFSRASQASGYSDFTADIIEAPQAAALPVVLSHGPASSLYLKYWCLWADLNRDGDFEDAGEILLQRASTSTGPVNGTITIPAGAAEGHTRLRVALSLNGYPDPCGTFSAGEVEDYTLAISATESAP
jgi:Zn-dependent metalloprotease/PKD repeat protein